MNVPEPLAEDRGGMIVRRYEYEDGDVIAIDFGQTTGELTVDLTDSTVRVDGVKNRLEFDMPERASDVFVNNGVLTIVE